MIKSLLSRIVAKSQTLIALRERYWRIKHIIFWKGGHYLSVLRRDQDIEHYLKTHPVRKLQVGCWPYLRDGWINSELYGSKELIPIDLLKPLPLPTNSIDYIFSEHVHEHFTFDQGQSMLKEFHRVLKKNGKIRIATPDLQFLIDLYTTKKSAIQTSYIKWSTDFFMKDLGIYQDTFLINTFVRSWGHEFIYDFKSLKWALEQVGFTDIKKFKPGKSNDKHLTDLESHWKSTTKEFNELETLVVEATKK